MRRWNTILYSLDSQLWRTKKTNNKPIKILQEKKIIHIKPVAKPRMTKSDAWKNRKCVKEYWAYKDKLREHKIDLPVPYKITFYLPIPKSTSKKKTLEMEGQPHMKRPDKDNLEKGFLDALYKEDSHIWSGWCEKRWSRNPRIIIEKL